MLGKKDKKEEEGMKLRQLKKDLQNEKRENLGN